MKKDQIICLIIGHEWMHTGTVGNPITGKYNYYECTRCKRTKTSNAFFV